VTEEVSLSLEIGRSVRRTAKKPVWSLRRHYYILMGAEEPDCLDRMSTGERIEALVAS
jgi:hypothetical protein